MKPFATGARRSVVILRTLGLAAVSFVSMAADLAVAQNRPASSGEAAPITNPFLPPGPARAAGARDDATALTPAMCDALIGRRTAGQALPPGTEMMVEFCVEQNRARQQDRLRALAEDTAKSLHGLVATARSGDEVRFRLGDQSYRGQVGQTMTIDGRELLVKLSGGILELALPDAVVRDVGLQKPVTVWRGGVGPWRSWTAPVAGAVSAGSAAPASAAAKMRP
jgi:hypothetical protein